MHWTRDELLALSVDEYHELLLMLDEEAKQA